jgi:hypothetical protein
VFAVQPEHRLWYTAGMPTRRTIDMPARSAALSTALAACLAAAGCLSSAGTPWTAIPLPPAGDIDAITVTPNFGDVRDTLKITDRAKIEQFVVFMTDHHDCWNQPSDTFPTFDYTVRVEHSSDAVAVFWVSPGQLGGRAGSESASSNRMRRLTGTDWEALKTILELAEPRTGKP